jgi:hypothetical protein
MGCAKSKQQDGPIPVANMSQVSATDAGAPGPVANGRSVEEEEHRNPTINWPTMGNDAPPLQLDQVETQLESGPAPSKQAGPFAERLGGGTSTKDALKQANMQKEKAAETKKDSGPFADRSGDSGLKGVLKQNNLKKQKTAEREQREEAALAAATARREGKKNAKNNKKKKKKEPDRGVDENLQRGIEESKMEEAMKRSREDQGGAPSEEEQLQQAIDQSKLEVKKQLVDFYRKRNPGKVKNVDAIMKTYEGRLHEIPIIMAQHKEEEKKKSEDAKKDPRHIAVRAQLVKFYQVRNPTKLKQIDSIMKQYEGRLGTIPMIMAQAMAEEKKVAVRKQLIDFYTELNPDKVKEVDTIMKQYEGFEEEIPKMIASAMSEKKVRGVRIYAGLGAAVFICLLCQGSTLLMRVGVTPLALPQ